MIFQHSNFSSKKYFRKKLNKKLFNYGILVILIIFIIGILSYISHRPSIRISKVILNGGVLVSQPDIESSSLSYMRGSYLWLFPKNNFLLYSRKDLQNYLKDTFRRIDIIDIHSEKPDTLVVDIIERKPVATWCDNLLEELERCYFMDSNSILFAEAPQFSGDAYFRYYGLVVGATPIGSYYIASSTQFAEIFQFIERSKQLSVNPIYIVAKEDRSFSMTLSSGGQIYFDTKEPLFKTSQNLEALLKTDALVKNISNIDYIDLRYGNKLFYKLK